MPVDKAKARPARKHTSRNKRVSKKGAARRRPTASTVVSVFESLAREPRLSAKRELFVAEYRKDLNATQAAIRAGYSAKTARSQGKRLLTNADVRRAVADGQQRRLEQAELTAERTLEEIRRIAYLDPIGIFDERGRLRHVKDMPPEVRACIASVEVLKVNTKSGDGVIDTVYKVKFWDKNKAVEMAAKHQALLVEQIKLSGTLHHVVDETATDEELLAQVEAILAKARARAVAAA